MIAPHKYLNLDISIISLGGIVLSVLKEENAIKYDELLEKVIMARGPSAREVFIPTLGFLFVLGKLNYDQETDLIVRSE